MQALYMNHHLLAWMLIIIKGAYMPPLDYCTIDIAQEDLYLPTTTEELLKVEESFSLN